MGHKTRRRLRFSGRLRRQKNVGGIAQIRRKSCELSIRRIGKQFHLRQRSQKASWLGHEPFLWCLRGTAGVQTCDMWGSIFLIISPSLVRESEANFWVSKNVMEPKGKPAALSKSSNASRTRANDEETGLAICERLIFHFSTAASKSLSFVYPCGTNGPFASKKSTGQLSPYHLRYTPANFCASWETTILPSTRTWWTNTIGFKRSDRNHILYALHSTPTGLISFNFLTNFLNQCHDRFWKTF